MNSLGKYYTDFAGKNTDANAAKDAYGNVRGNQYDLARDGAFAGKTVVVMDLNTDNEVNFSHSRKALEEKGFSVVFWQTQLPSLVDFKRTLSTASQFWLLSGAEQRLNRDFRKIIIDFFNEGRGLFLLGENDPFNKDVTVIAKKLFGATISGDTEGRQKVTLQKEDLVPESALQRFIQNTFFSSHRVGIVRNHPITTGLEVLFEGVTIATISENKNLTPIMYGSAGNLVTACYDKHGKRALLDGGYTRLYRQWDTAGTARFVKNAAAWLANAERETRGAGRA